MKLKIAYLLPIVAFLSPILGFLIGGSIPPPFNILLSVIIGILLGSIVTNLLFDLTKKEADLEKEKLNSENMRKTELDILNKIGDLVFKLDLNANVTSLNERAEKLFGSRSMEILGKSITELLPSNSISIFTAKINELGDLDYIPPFEIEFDTIYGKKIFEMSLVSLIKDGRPNHIIGIGWDVTERKLIEQKLREKVSEIEKLTKRTLNREMRIFELEEEVKKQKQP